MLNTEEYFAHQYLLFNYLSVFFHNLFTFEQGILFGAYVLMWTMVDKCMTRNLVKHFFLTE